MKKFLIILAACAIGCLHPMAQDAVDPYDLSFADNIKVPEVTGKAAKPIRNHMREISETLSKHKVDVKLVRNGEVVEVTIPCSKLFLPNETKLKEEGKKFLEPYVGFLKYPTMYKVVVAVHSDATGEEDYLDSLTDERAAAIDLYLSEASQKDGENVIPYGIGADMPLMPNNSIANRDKNRRVEIYIIPEQQMIERAKSGKLN